MLSTADDLIKLIKIIDGTVSRLAGIELITSSQGSNTEICILLSECCEIREKLRLAVTLAGAISETNIQCMLHILALKQDQAKVDESHRREIQTLQGRIDSLSSVLQYQTAHINDLSQFNALSKFWETVVFPICGMEVKSPERSHSESASPSSVANAMAHISVYCADKMKMQFEMNQNEDNSNDLLDNIGAKLAHVVNVIGQMEAEHHGTMCDNSNMRDQLIHNKQIIDHLVYRLGQSTEDMEVLRFENEDIRSRLSATLVLLNTSVEDLKVARRQCNRMSDYLNTTKEELKHVTALYFDTLGLCKQWQNCFDNISTSKSVKFDMSSNLQRDLDVEANDSDHTDVEVEAAEAIISTPDSRKIPSSNRSRREELIVGAERTDDAAAAVCAVVPPMQWSASTVAPVDETHFCQLSAESPATEPLHPALPTSERRHYISRVENSRVSNQYAQHEDSTTSLSPIRAKGLFPPSASSTSSSSSSRTLTGPSHLAHYQLPTENCLRRLYSAYKERQRRQSEATNEVQHLIA